MWKLRPFEEVSGVEQAGEICKLGQKHCCDDLEWEEKCGDCKNYVNYWKWFHAAPEEVPSMEDVERWIVAGVAADQEEELSQDQCDALDAAYAKHEASLC